MYYMPVLPNGQIAPLPWQIKTFYYNIGWPLKDNAKLWMKILYSCMASLACFIYLFVDEAEIIFILNYFSIDITLSVEGLLTNCVLNESLLRVFDLVYHQNQFKEFLKHFFRDIYIYEKENKEILKKIRRQLIPCTLYSYIYMTTLAIYIITPITSVLGSTEKTLPYKMSLPYSYDNPYIYGITLFYLCWMGYCSICFMVGEVFTMSSCIIHLNARYDMVHEDLQQFSSSLIATVPSSQLALEFRRAIVRKYIRICELNLFAELLNKTYRFRIFVTFAFSAVFLCTLLFQLSALGASTDSVKNATCIIAKVFELLIFGSLGTEIIETTYKTSSMYYLSNWEQIIHHSTNRQENIVLMKSLGIMMILHKDSLRITGLNYFDISFDTVVKVLRCAFSYFTCLSTVKEQ